MTKMFAPKVSTPQMADRSPTNSPAVEAAADAERMRQRRQRGTAATMLTGAQGAGAGNVGTTQLLGG